MPRVAATVRAPAQVRRAARVAAEEILVRGLVQGVGFRPTVYRLAIALGLRGYVCNEGRGVRIDVCGAPSRIEDFVRALVREPPPLSRIDGLERRTIAPFSMTDFRIAESDAGPVQVGVTPDAATCKRCLGEIADPRDRRYGYAFTNCTHCGPRLTILRAIPYDRANTSMAAFALCSRCEAEYRDPTDRRFHAQPNACPECGPQLLYCAGEEEYRGAAVLEQAARALRAGRIVAVKGLGGVHLACDAGDEAAVRRLRERKRRYEKPLAMMARDLVQVRVYCVVRAEEARLLKSPAAPIVLLRRRKAARLADALAPGQSHYGFMLPYTPLHHMLMARLDRPLVLTSGNQSDEPQCIGNDEARRRLAGIADAFLLHDRGIVNRVDDSVARVVAGRVRLLRRARGYAPAPVVLPDGFASAPPTIALGGELKNTIGLLREGGVVLSQHIGDLEHAQAYAAFQATLELYRKMLELEPAVVAVDCHPEYLSSKFGREWARHLSLPLVEVQHHHAHIAACLAENGVPLDAPPVLGIALDGLGYGDDGGLWGGEFLCADYRNSRRLAAFAPVPMPGGMQAIREPWRMAYACLPTATDLPVFCSRSVKVLAQMLARGINCPSTTSCGRLFDAAAALIGLRAMASYEGQAACELEAAVDARALKSGERYPFGLGQAQSGGLVLVEHREIWPMMASDIRRGISPGRVAARFHNGIVEAVVTMVEHLTRQHGDPWQGRVALSGGVFQNAILTRALPARLRARGFTVYEHSRVPANDGGLALGQAAVAAARWLGGDRACA